MKRILIIEDDKSISELQKDYLEMAGYEVICAFDGNTGLNYIDNHSFDLIILDLMLRYIKRNSRFKGNTYTYSICKN